MSVEFPENLTKEFLSDLLADKIEDWTTARKYGEFLIALCPTLLIGHLVLCRALRHAGDLPLAVKELRICRTIVSGADFYEQEFLPELEHEERFLNTGT